MIYPDLPVKALSLRQPWAWAILHAGKPIENRPRRMNFRGRVAIHASLWKNDAEEIANLRWIRDTFGVRLPEYGSESHEAFRRGGIVGSMEITGCQGPQPAEHGWGFAGQYWIYVSDPKPCEFIPVKGMLGLFNWRNNL